MNRLDLLSCTAFLLPNEQENLVETHFNVMRRMSQVYFEQVTSWEGAKAAHERFVTDYNAQSHGAHRKRDDNRFSPAEVLGWVTNKLRTPEHLHRIFYATRFLRRLSRLGYVHFRRWKLYGEEALARQPALVWLHGDALTVEYEETPQNCSHKQQASLPLLARPGEASSKRQVLLPRPMERSMVQRPRLV
jgi:hypothetical protein